MHTEHHIRIHSDETAVAIEGKASVAREFRETFNRFVIQAEVQNRIHHAGHRGARARAN